ncbi:Receptor expression-enhancing protein 1, partial [Galemys pyrenaicus]
MVSWIISRLVVPRAPLRCPAPLAPAINTRWLLNLAGTVAAEDAGERAAQVAAAALRGPARALRIGGQGREGWGARGSAGGCVSPRPAPLFRVGGICRGPEGAHCRNTPSLARGRNVGWGRPSPRSAASLLSGENDRAQTILPGALPGGSDGEGWRSGGTVLLLVARDPGEPGVVQPHSHTCQCSPREEVGSDIIRGAGSPLLEGHNRGEQEQRPRSCDPWQPEPLVVCCALGTLSCGLSLNSSAQLALLQTTGGLDTTQADVANNQGICAKGTRLIFGTLYPAYYSYKAVKSKDIKEYVKWMMYWIIFALFTTAETFTDIFLCWFPFYYELKIAFVAWLLSPYTKGSSLLYRKFVHPTLSSKEKEIDDCLVQAKDRSYDALVHFGKRGLNVAATAAVMAASKVTRLFHFVYSLDLREGQVTLLRGVTNSKLIHLGREAKQPPLPTSTWLDLSRDRVPYRRDSGVSACRTSPPSGETVPLPHRAPHHQGLGGPVANTANPRCPGVLLKVLEAQVDLTAFERVWYTKWHVTRPLLEPAPLCTCCSTCRTRKVVEGEVNEGGVKAWEPHQVQNPLAFSDDEQEDLLEFMYKFKAPRNTELPLEV